MQIVYTDFFHYHSGVYEHDKDSEVAGGHAVRIIGWGYDNTTDADYWLVRESEMEIPNYTHVPFIPHKVANSWNMDWGDNGFFKIARGQDECQIETWGINYAEPNLADAAH
jgi:cathepsin B